MCYTRILILGGFWMNNELLSNNVRYFDVDFKKLTPEMFNEALEKRLELAKQEVQDLRSNKKPSFKELFYSPESSGFLNVLSMLYSLCSLKEDLDLRKVLETYEEKWTEFYMSCMFDEKLFKKTEAFVVTDEFKNLNKVRQKMVLKYIEKWRENGVGLPGVEKKKFTKITEKLNKLKFKFKNNNTDANKDMFLIVSKNSLKGLSERSWKNAEKLSKEKNMPEGKIYIDEISGLFSDVMKDVRNEGVRKRIYNMRKNKCLKGKFSNVKLINEIYKLNQEKAKILGYKNVVDMQVHENMAETPEKVREFIDTLGSAAQEVARKDMKALNDFGRNLLKREMKFWDTSYVMNKMEKKLAKLDSEELRKYFPVSKVIEGLFKFCEDKFNVRFVEDKTKSLWHDDVTFYNVYEGDNHIGGIFFDLFKREGKSGGAWLSPICSSRNNDIDQAKAYAMLVCNSSKDEGTPTFSFYEVETLFHEMGHGLHHLLSKAQEEYYSGFNNVQFDAIEFPSQLLEMFTYNQDVLKMISSHVETGEPLNARWIKKIQESKKFMGSLTVMTTLTFSDIDHSIYTQFDEHPFDIEKLVKSKWQINDIIDTEMYMTKTFGHIFAGGYKGNYYVYQWAEVLSADAYQYLTEKVSKSEIQKRFDKYKTCVLYTGGEESMANNYRDFVGRDPEVKALLEQYI